MDRLASNGRFHTFNVPDDWLEEPVRVQSAPQDDEFERPQFFDAVTGEPSTHPPAPSQARAAAQVWNAGTCFTRPRGPSPRV